MFKGMRMVNRWIELRYSRSSRVSRVFLFVVLVCLESNSSCATVNGLIGEETEQLLTCREPNTNWLSAVVQCQFRYAHARTTACTHERIEWEVTCKSHMQTSHTCMSACLWPFPFGADALVNAIRTSIYTYIHHAITYAISYANVYVAALRHGGTANNLPTVSDCSQCMVLMMLTCTTRLFHSHNRA